MTTCSLAAGLVANVSPASRPQWRFGAAIFALDLPTAMVELDSANDGFGMRIDAGLGLSGSYFFANDRRGWYAGPSANRRRDRRPGRLSMVSH